MFTYFHFQLQTFYVLEFYFLFCFGSMNDAHLMRGIKKFFFQLQRDFPASKNYHFCIIFCLKSRSILFYFISVTLNILWNSNSKHEPAASRGWYEIWGPWRGRKIRKNKSISKRKLSSLSTVQHSCVNI